MRNKKIICISLILISAMFFAGCGKKTQVETTVNEPKNVKIVNAINANITTEVEYACKLKPVDEVNISAKTPGRVAAVNYEVGQKVSKNDILFTLEAKDIMAQIQQQKAGEEVSRVNLERTKDSGLEQQITTAEQGLERAQIAYDTAKYNFDGQEKLYEMEAISEKEYIDSQTKLKSALTELGSAQKNLRLVKEKSGPQSIELASAQLRQSEVGVLSTKVALDNTIIKAPISGIISGKNANVGEISSGVAYTIIDTTQMYAEVYVSDKMMAKVHKQQKINLKIFADGNKVVEGVVDNISPSADETSQTYIIKIKIKNSDNILKPGMFAKVMLPAESKQNILTIPKSAIKIENGINYVYIVDNGVIKKVAVTTGLFNDKVIEITSKLKAGDQVITEGQIFLNDGEKVNIVK